MKAKFILTVLFLFCMLKSNAQTPSINERKSTIGRNADIETIDKKLVKARIKDLKLERRTLKKEIKTAAPLVKEVNNKKIESLNKEIKHLRKDKRFEGYNNYYSNQIIKKNDSITTYFTLIRNHDFTKIKLDSINKLIAIKQEKLLLLTVERDETLASLDKFSWVLPTWKKANRKKFFHDMYSNDTNSPILLNSLALNTNSDATSIQNEIITDNMWAVRLTLGSVLSIASGQNDSSLTPEQAQQQIKKETEKEALSRLINGGGNFYLEGIFPLFTTNQDNGDQITSYTYANLRGAMDISKISRNIDTSTGNGTVGVNSYFGISSDNRKFNFFFQGNVNFTFGSTHFYNNLGLNNEKAFLNGKIIAGITILNQFRFLATINTFGSDEKLRSNNVAIGIQILPGL
ncbi:hypothetical protein [Flavobacterium sp. NKUCC04_CG]|uniref:hypothetical protein n=1 Tax=Flavobacterium sp. NKUCC04_CG TaxID=2842121 RepID=UPI001C5B5D1D|nr:hypothetical protein [Flavobacterium sp. NKUCC04_CG]MBW3518045.1 hypothetical protein [Flavobacterium sp. NKUCC04_CG]